jgi:hypothetical protein
MKVLKYVHELVFSKVKITRLPFKVHAPFFVIRRRNEDVPGHVKKTCCGVEAEHHSFLPSPVYGQHYFPTALPMGNEPLVPVEQKAMWAPEPVWKLWGGNKSAAPATILRTSNLEIIQCIDSASGTKN